MKPPQTRVELLNLIGREIDPPTWDKFARTDVTSREHLRLIGAAGRVIRLLQKIGYPVPRRAGDPKDL